MTASTLYRSQAPARADGLAQLVRAEWTKFRTIRGWVVGMLVAGLLVVGVGLLGHSECGSQLGSSATLGGPGCVNPLGPGGEAVADGFYFVHQPLTGHGAITVRVTSYSPDGASGPGANQALSPWSKAGIIMKASTRPGSAYAAMMVTGSHGVRMQWDFTQDTPGLAGPVSAASPRWLRLTRSGDAITGYDSADGTHWVKVGTATLAGLPSAVQAGLFAASGDYSDVTSQSIGGGSGRGGSIEATATFDHVAVTGGRPGAWVGTDVGGAGGPPPAQGDGYRQPPAGFTVTGSGDIAPDVPGYDDSGSVTRSLVGTFAGLIAVIVLGTMFITGEYRRGLIRVTLTASPRRHRVLAAKAIVIGAVTFVVGLPAALGALLAGEARLRSGGVFVDPVTALTEVRMIAGTAALLAVAAILALATGALLRRGAAAVTAVIVMFVLPYFFASPLALLPAGTADWLLRLTPAAAFSIQQAYPRYPQVVASYTAPYGYYPLAPWAGFGVLCGWTVLALGAAMYLLSRRDA